MRSENTLVRYMPRWLWCVCLTVAICAGNWSRDASRAWADSPAQYPIKATGQVTLKGKSYAFEAEYWSDHLRFDSSHLKSVPKGLHEPYIVDVVQTAAAKTIEAARACYTRSSTAWFDAHLEFFKDILEAEAKQKESTPAQYQLFLTVRLSGDASAPTFVVTAAGGYMAEDKAGPPFAVNTYSLEDGQWKGDATLFKHAVFREAQEGRWKQFGAPRDIGDQEGSTPAAALPTTQPNSRN